MGFYKWIDRSNARYCKKIIIKYYFEANNNISYARNSSFYVLYAKRMFMVFLSMVFLKRKTFKTFLNIIKGTSLTLYSSNDPNVKFSKLKEFLWMLSGHGYFVDKQLLPGVPEDEILKTTICLNLSANPLVSIVIPVYNQLSYTYNCLVSLKNHLPLDVDVEIIIVDDCSTDQTFNFFGQKVIGVRYIRNTQNLGFLLNCNRAVANARGKYICLLNNDTQIKRGWLEALLDEIENNLETGVAGSKLVFHFGLIQEAGGIISKTGDTDRYGSYMETNIPEFNKRKKVDYISGASILFKKSDFETLGGFDERFGPAYYEDTDLSMSIQHILKKNIIYVPQSEIIHFEGASSNRLDIKQRILTNRSRFVEKWKNELESYPDRCG